MDKVSTELAEITSKWLKTKKFDNQTEEDTYIEAYITQHRNYKGISLQQNTQAIQLIQTITLQKKQLCLKPLQLLRFLTKPKENRKMLREDFLCMLNERMQEVVNVFPLLIEILAIHLRYIDHEQKYKWIAPQMLNRILDLLALNNPQTTLVIIQITRGLAQKGVTKVFDEVWYVGRLLFALERLQAHHKPKLIHLISQLLESESYNRNFRRINGTITLINEVKRSGSNLTLRLSLYNCIYKLLLSTNTQIIYDFKLNNFTSLLSLKLKEPMNFKETSLTLKIMTHLMLDNDLSTRYIEDGVADAIVLLVRAHPNNCHLIKFQDIPEDQENQAFDQFKLMLLRLLRYVCSLDRNRKIFKKIFPLQLLGPFMDVGHFVKPLASYEASMKCFNELDNNKVLAIQDEYEQLNKMMNNKNFKLEVVGNYNVTEQLGQGAFGCVYLAKKGFNEYALKRIKLEALPSQKDGRDWENHKREIKIYKELKHPNIVKFYESFVEDGYVYIVMEVVKGCNLSELIRNQNEKGSFFDEETVWRLLIAILSVLRYMHCQKKIIHRDLNPSNVMVDNKLNVKVADFGLAKAISAAKELSNSFVGTLVYSCPQIVKNQGYSQKADIWSLGCIIFELLTLRVPFTGNNPLLLAKNITNREFTTQISDKYSPEIRKFVELCLTPEEQNRPTVTDLLRQVVDKLCVVTDQLREKEFELSQEIVSMNKKINSGGLANTHTRVFGTSLHSQNHTNFRSSRHQMEDTLRQTQIVKIDSEVLSKIGEDPMSKFIDVVKKLSLIVSTQATLKKSFKKYVVDTFYNHVLISSEVKNHQVKDELQKLIHLDKEEVPFLGVKFDSKQNFQKSITYEMLYFYIEELYELIRKL